MDPSVILSCSSESMVGKGQGAGNEASTIAEVALVKIRGDTTTVISGESAFVYNNVVTEGPEEEEDLSSSLPSVSEYEWASHDASWEEKILRGTGIG